ncbi:hypothetical protein EON77_15980, partial [bacterium]
MPVGSTPGALTTDTRKVLTASTGTEATCAIVVENLAETAGDVFCFGRNRAGTATGMLGVSLNEANRPAPLPLGWLGNEIASVDVGQRTGCAIRSNGSLACWGSNDGHQLGDGTTANRAPGVEPTGMLTGVVRVAVGAHTACSIRGTSAYCWGASVYPNGVTPERTDAAYPLVSAVEPALMDFCQFTSGELDASGPEGPACASATECGETVPICADGFCRRCRTDGECGRDTPVCSPEGACVECTSTNKTRCVGLAQACDIEAGVCTDACQTDADCGDAASGKVCDPDQLRCIDGCRGTSGNGCPAPLFCSSTTQDVGSCRGGRRADGSADDIEGSGPFRFESSCGVARSRGLGDGAARLEAEGAGA